jgi:hypothetical protein
MILGSKKPKRKQERRKLGSKMLKRKVKKRILRYPK